MTVTVNVDPFSRLEITHTFREGGLERWRASRLAVIGCGNLGSRLAIEAVRSGATLFVCDPDVGELVNLGTQAVQSGRPKVASVVEACEAIRPGSAEGYLVDVRHLGIGVLRRCHLLVDCTDDPRLALLLTEISNGLRIPLLRLALDGSGERELGRVLCSDGGNGGACQICSYGGNDLWRDVEPTPCPGQPTGERPPTLAGKAGFQPPPAAGGALGMSVGGLGLLQAQRLITGNDLASVWNREVIVDWSNMQVFSAELRRSEECLSGHQHWELIEIPVDDALRYGDMFDIAATHLETSEITLEAYGHPLCVEASCLCGERHVAIGTRWGVPPSCPACGGEMNWESVLQLTRVGRRRADSLGIVDRTLEQLGFPAEGALFIAHAQGHPPLRVLLTGSTPDFERRGDLP